MRWVIWNGLGVALLGIGGVGKAIRRQEQVAMKVLSTSCFLGLPSTTIARNALSC